MALLEQLNNDMITCMKNKDSFSLGVIRMVKGAIQLEKMAKKPSSKLHKYLHKTSAVSCVVWIKMYQMRHKWRKNAGWVGRAAVFDAKNDGFPCKNTV